MRKRKKNTYKDFILKQLTECIQKIKCRELVIAYEPIWSIGTGIIPKVEDIIEISELIFSFLKKEKIDKNLLKFDLIHEQNVTDSSFSKPHIKPMSNAFNYSINEFNKNPNISNYNAIINNCKSCHQLSCQGPLMKINKLSIETKIL